VTVPLSVGIAGCGAIGRKRAAALGTDQLVVCYDVDPVEAGTLAAEYGATACGSLDELLGAHPDVVIVAAFHSELARLACAALESGAHVLVEKPAATSSHGVEHIRRSAAAAGRQVAVGFNHRFHPGFHRALSEARSGRYGEVMFVRGRYGHGGRLGYDREWRADPALSGGGELVDQGMHLIDLCHVILGDMPLHSAMLRTHFWDAPVEDNAVIVLGAPGGIGDSSPWAMLHVSWTEWKNLFSLEIYCRTAKFALDGLTGSYGPQRLRLYRMRPELGPPDVEEVQYPSRDTSFEVEWSRFAEMVRTGRRDDLLGDLESAAYAWRLIEDARSR
jgi:predicted dehydrogenase